MSLHERYVLVSESNGVFLGTRQGFGVWSACDLTVRTSAPTYVTEEDAMQVRLLKQERPLKVLCVDPDQATLAEIVAAGGPAWAPGRPVEIQPLPDHKVLIDPVTVADGKYIFFMEEDGLLDCLRNGERWPAFRGSGSHLSGSQLALYHDLLAARKEAARLYETILEAARNCEPGSKIHVHVLSPWSMALRRIVEGKHEERSRFTGLGTLHDLLAVRKQAEALATVIDGVVQAAAMGGYPVAPGTCEHWIKALRKIAKGKSE